MKFASKNRWLIATIAFYITLFIFDQANYYLAPYGISIMVTGMLLSFSSLNLSHTQGSLSLIPIAFYLDTKTPFPFGSTLLVLIGLHYAAVLVRHQLRRETEGVSLAVALVANLALFAIYTLLAASYSGTEGLNGFQITMNLLASSLVIALLNLHYRRALIEMFGFFGIDIAQEKRQSR